MNAGDAVYVVLIEDRHTDVEVHVYTMEARAIKVARAIATDRCRDGAVPDESRTPSMVRDGWLYYATYSVELDSVRVVRREVQL